MRMIVIFHIDDYRVVYYTIIMAVYFTEIIYSHVPIAMPPLAALQCDIHQKEQ